MGKLMNQLYDNIDESKAFFLSFTNMVFMHDDYMDRDFTTIVCEECGKDIQSKDYLFPKASCKKPTGILSTLEFGVSQELRDDLIEQFDITEEDFRPIRSKKGEIVYYQITPRHVMLPLHKENDWSIQKECPRCGSVQYFLNHFYNEKKEPFNYISKEALDDMHDLNITYERGRFYLPEVVISRRVYDYLTDRYPRTHYFPLFIK